MAHLAQHAAIRAGDALDRAHRAVRVPRDVHRRLARKVSVLERDLTVLCEVVDHALRGDEATLAVRDRDRMEVAYLAGGQPRALNRRDAGGHIAALVAADQIEGQRRVVAAHLIADLAIGDKAELNERLEAVADAEH